jgi:DNA-binding HxlR family transcriptional regulator
VRLAGGSVWSASSDPRPWRYSELEATLDISPTTLPRRLPALEEAGIVERRLYEEIPPHVEYSTTERGELLRPMFAYLGEWVTDSERET